MRHSERSAFASGMLVLVFLAILPILACVFSKTIETGAGDFKIKGDPLENTRLEGVWTIDRVQISFKPKDLSCECEEITYLQAARSRDGTGKLRYASPEASKRASNGWTVDKSIGNDPWFPVKDDGSYDPQFGTPGSSTEPATLKDTPGAERGYWPLSFEFMSCAVCKSGDEKCQGRVLGCIYWSFQIDNDGKVTKPDARAPTAKEKEDVKGALDRWNETADSTGHKLIPRLTNFP